MATNFQPNFSPEHMAAYRGQELLIAGIVFTVVNTLLFMTRVVSRRYQKAPFALHDALIILAYLSFLGLVTTCFLTLRYGCGYHVERILTRESWKYPHYGRTVFYAMTIFYMLATNFPKLSVCFLCLTLFNSRFTKVSYWVIIVVLILNMIINITLVGVQCLPQEKTWNPLLPGHCHNIQAHYIYVSVPSIVTDVVMILIPIPVVWNLHVAKYVKMGLVATFFIAGAGLITAIIRLLGFVRTTFTVDPTWAGPPLFIWTIVEASGYLICACLLCCGQIWSMFVHSRLVSTFFSKLSSFSSRSSSSDELAEKVKYVTRAELSHVDSHGSATQTLHLTHSRNKAMSPPKSERYDIESAAIREGVSLGYR